MEKKHRKRQINKLGPLQKDNDGQLWWVDKRFNKWLEHTTVHGIVHVFKGKSTLKRIFWLFIFVGAVTGLLINVVNRFQYLLSSPTATSVRIDNNQDGVQFPAVTICNLTPIDKYTAAQYGVVDFIDLLYGSIIFHDYDDDSFSSSIAECDRALINSVPDEVKAESLRDLLANGQLSVHDFIVSCSYGTLSNNGDEAVYCVDQFKPIMTNLGLCYTFNGELNSTRKVAVTGQRYGLRLVLDIHQDYFETSINNDVGIKISLDPQGLLPEPDERGIAVSPGQYAYIALKTEQTIDNSGANNCKNKETRLTYFPDRYYSQTGCKLDRYVNDILNNCSCTDTISQLSLDNVKTCTINDICCVFTSDVLFSSMYCPVECDKLEYSSSVSYSQYPLKSIASELAEHENITTEDIYRNLLGVSIYFESVATSVSKTTSSYTVTAFLSDLGGQLGLFIGASVISMLEMGLFCVDELKNVVCAGKVKKKVKKFEKWSHLPEVTGGIEEKYIISQEDIKTEAV